MISKYIKTLEISMHSRTNGGLLYMLPEIILKLAGLVPLMFLWHVLAESGADSGMTVRQMLTYTYISVLLSDMTVVRTVASDWCYEGELSKLYICPVPVFGHLAAQTVGGWIPMLLMFSLPMLFFAPLFGVDVMPATAWFFPSLLLCVSLGFAIDFLFACVAIRLRGISWLAHVIRMSVTALFSGTVILFKLLPFGMKGIFELQPFGSLGGAPLSLFAGTAEPVGVIMIQILWNAVLWPAALIWFGKSQEKMVSFGG